MLVLQLESFVPLSVPLRYSCMYMKFYGLEDSFKYSLFPWNALPPFSNYIFQSIMICP